MPLSSELRVILVGNVDDGKSTLLGRLLYDSRVLLDDHLAALERDGLNLAHLTDGLKAERERGITIDLAYRFFSTSKRKFVLIDAPGHAEYTRNMVTGASQADVGLIVIDVTRGIQPQTRRHCFLLSLLKVDHVIVCVNKMDLVGYGPEPFQKCQAQFLEMSKNLNLKSLSFLPLSALAGENVVRKSQKMQWFKTDSLLELLESIEIDLSTGESQFRFPIQGRVAGAASGRVLRGELKVGEEISIFSKNFPRRSSKVSSIEQYPRSLLSCSAGDSVAIHLSPVLSLERGDWIFQGEMKVARELMVSIIWFFEQPLKKESAWIFRHGTQELGCKVLELLDCTDQDSLVVTQNPPELYFNQVGRVRMGLESDLAYDHYENCKWTGSAVLIDPETGATVAAVLI